MSASPDAAAGRYGSGFCVARDCTLREVGFAVSVDEVAHVILDECRIVNPRVCAFYRQCVLAIRSSRRLLCAS